MTSTCLCRTGTHKGLHVMCYIYSNVSSYLTYSYLGTAHTPGDCILKGRDPSSESATGFTSGAPWCDCVETGINYPGNGIGTVNKVQVGIKQIICCGCIPYKPDTCINYWKLNSLSLLPSRTLRPARSFARRTPPASMCPSQVQAIPTS